MEGICEECTDNKVKRLAKRRPPLCGYHYQAQQRKKSFEKNKDKPKKVYALKRTPLTYKRKPTGELPVMKRIWASTKEHKSFISDEPIKKFHVRNMAHVISKAKNKYPEFKLYVPNIRILTWKEHDQWDNGVREDLKKLPEWNKMFELEEKLKLEYQKTYGTTN